MTDTNNTIWKKLISTLAVKDFLPLLFVYLVLLTYSTPFGTSLWLDETVSVWISQAGSLSEVVSSAFFYQGQSPLYFIVLSLFQMLTTDFALLRVISFGVLLLSAYVLFRIVEFECEGRAPAAVAVMGYLTMDRVIANGVSLRPYSLGLLCCFLSIYCLLRYEHGRPMFIWRIGHVASFVVALYCHYFFAAQMIVHIVLTWRRPSKGESSGWIEFVVNHVVVMLCLIPMFGHLQALANRSSELTIASLPTISSLGLMIFPLALTVSFLLSLIFALVFFVPGVSFQREGWRKSWKLVVSWWLLAPLAFALLAWLGGVNIFLDRYLLWTSGGACLALSLLFSSLSPLLLRNTAIVVFCLVVSIRTTARQWKVEDWQGAARTLQEMNTDESPVLAYTGLIEAESPDWLRAHPRYLSAPLLIYGVTQRITALPSRFHTDAAKAYLQNDLTPDLHDIPEAFVVVAKKEVVTESGEIKEISQPLIDTLADTQQFSSETVYESSTLLIVRLHRSLERSAASD